MILPWNEPLSLIEPQFSLNLLLLTAMRYLHILEYHFDKLIFLNLANFKLSFTSRALIFPENTLGAKNSVAIFALLHVDSRYIATL